VDGASATPRTALLAGATGLVGSALLSLLPKGVRPIRARAVASALLTAILTAKPGVQVLKSRAMQTYDQP